LQHREEAEPFYQSLSEQQVRVGMEACGHYPWCEQWLAEVGIELWFGDAAKLRLEVREVRQLLVHRHKQVQARTRTKNQKK